MVARPAEMVVEAEGRSQRAGFAAACCKTNIVRLGAVLYRSIRAAGSRHPAIDGGGGQSLVARPVQSAGRAPWSLIHGPDDPVRPALAPRICFRGGIAP